MLRINEETGYFRLCEWQKKTHKSVLLGHLKQVYEEKQEGNDSEAHKLFVRMVVYSADFDLVSESADTPRRRLCTCSAAWEGTS